MKELQLKIKREYYNIFKELNDRQAGELVKGMCAYMYDNKPFFTKDPYLKGVFMTVKKDIDVAKNCSINGKKGAEVVAEKRRQEALNRLGMIVGGVLASAEMMNRCDQEMCDNKGCPQAKKNE